MFEKLTPKQEEQIAVVRKKWLSRFFSGFREIDRDRATDGINWLYELAGLSKPKKVVFVSSPAGAQLAANIIGGDRVWDQVRAQVWDQVRAQVWDQVRAQVRAQVWDQVWDQVRAQVWAQARAQVRAQVWDQVWDQVRAQVWAQVWDQVWAQVWDQVLAQVRAQVGDQVWDQVRAQGLKTFDFASCGSVWDYGWVAFYDYFLEVGVKVGAGIEQRFRAFQALVESNTYDMIQLRDYCIVCEFPQSIKRDEQNRLHSETDAAVWWADTYEQHYLHGIFFEKSLWEQIVKKTIKPKELLGLSNIEQRMVAMKVYGMETLLSELNANLLDKSERGNELYLLQGLFSTNPDAYFLKYACPSTGRVYVSGVDPAYAKKNPRADLCMAWKFGLTGDEYGELRSEA